MTMRLKKVLWNLAYCIHEETGVIVVVHNKMVPTDEEWYDYYIPDTIRFAEMNLGRRLFICTDGGAPSADQRKALDQYHQITDQKNQQMRMAVVCQASGVVRIAVMVINVLFGKNRLRMFENTRVATEWLGLSDDEHLEIQDVLNQLRKSLDASALSREADEALSYTRRPEGRMRHLREDGPYPFMTEKTKTEQQNPAGNTE